MKERRSSRAKPHRVTGLCVAVVLALLLVDISSGASVESSPALRQVNAKRSSRETQFQCEKAFPSGSQGRSRCFDQLPGASCAHPLELQKAGPTTRGDTRYLTASFHQEANGAGSAVEVFYSWAPKKGVAICPYPNGVVFKETPMYRTEPTGREVLAGEQKTTNTPIPTSRHGGSWSHEITAKPLTSWYLAIRGYFIHPPWAGRR
jgi:hypothetical protein